MSKQTPNLKLTLTSSSEGNKLFKDWVDENTGDSAEANLQKIDEAVGSINEKISSAQQNLDSHIASAAVHVSKNEKAVWNGKADLVGGKVPTSQLPEMDYDPSGSAAAVQGNLDTHLADSVGHITADERSRWNHYPTSFSLSASSWSTNSTYTDYGYRASLSISGLTAKDAVDIHFDGSSYATANDCGVAGFTETVPGAVYLYSAEKPSLSLTGNYIVIKGESL